MILRDFPRPCPVPGWPSFVVDASGTELEYPERAGPLSIKCVFRGSELHAAGDARFVVEPGRYLLLNQGRRYASAIHSRRPVDTFSVFFRPGLAEEVQRSLTTPADALLDDPAPAAPAPVEFYERLYPYDDRVMPELLDLRSRLRRGPVDDGWLEERLRRLLERLLERHRDVAREVARLPAVRPSTREELYRRLHRGRDLIDGCYAEPLTLERIAAAACLAPHHFLRLFKAAFGTTPHGYLTRRRLERARQLLAASDRSIADVALAVGYQSPTSFANLFRRHAGASPSAYRRRHRR